MRKPPIWNDAAETRELEARQAQEEITAQRLADEQRFGPFTPFCLRCPLDAAEDVARGLRIETAIRFLLARHVIVIGGDEWALDGDLELWRRAKAYARELNHQGLLKAIQRQGELVYQKIESGPPHPLSDGPPTPITRKEPL